MRTEYRNGDAIILQENGCDGCKLAMINGVPCHEQGCPEAWRDSARTCRWCGREFYPSDESQPCCSVSCFKSYYLPPVWEDK